MMQESGSLVVGDSVESVRDSEENSYRVVRVERLDYWFVPQGARS